MASSSTFPSSVLNWQPIHQFKNKIMSWNPAPPVRVVLIMMNLLEVIWFDQVDLHTSPVTHTCNLDDLVFVIWIPKRLRLTGFCYVELLQRLLQQKFLLRPQRSYFFLNNMEPCTSMHSVRLLRLFEFIYRNWTIIHPNFQELRDVLFIPRTRDLDPRPQAAEPLPSPTCPGEVQLPSLEKIAEKMIVLELSKVSYSNS